MVAGAGATLAMPFILREGALGAEPIVLGLPTSQTAAAGVADDLDHLNGSTLAMEEINASGGILGRELKLFVTDVDKLFPGELQTSDRGLCRRQGARDFECIPVRAHSGHGRVGRVQMSLSSGQHATRRHRRFQGQSGKIQSHLPDRSVGSELRLDLSDLAGT
jgi:hypothetical protein